MNFYVISYDISDDKWRRQVADILENFATRVQYSVFEANIKEHELKTRQEQLAGVVDLTQDSLCFYRLCQNCLDDTDVWGNSKITIDPDYYLVWFIYNIILGCPSGFGSKFRKAIKKHPGRHAPCGILLSKLI